MNRMEEYEALVSRLEAVPPSDCVRKALRRRRRKLAAGRSIGAVVLALCVFVGTINLSPEAAAACHRLPFLQELTDLLIFRPSVRMAVEHDYLQVPDRRQTQADITACVEYLVVDRKQVNLYYRLRSDRYDALSATPEVCFADGSPVPAILSYDGRYADNDRLRELTVDFKDEDVPDTLVLTLEVYENGRPHDEASAPVPDSREPSAPEVITTFTFTLTFDPFFTAQGEQLALNREVELDGQQITIAGAELYPTHIRIKVLEHPENTARLDKLNFYLELDNGDVINTIQDGVISTGNADEPYTTEYWAESSYFQAGKPVRMQITGADFLDLAHESVNLDLKTQAHDPLPEGTKLTGVWQTSDGWAVAFGLRETEAQRAQLLKDAYEDGSGASHSIARFSSVMQLYDEQGEPVPGWREETYFLEGITSDTVTLHLNYNRFWHPAQPVSVDLN